MVSSVTGVFSVILAVVAVSFIIQRFKFFAMFGPVLPAIIMGIILSNLNIIPHWHSSYGFFLGEMLFVTIAIMMLDIDLKELVKLSKQPLIAMIFAIISVSVMAIIGGIVFAPQIDQGWMLGGMFVGTYTGGSSNLTAIGVGLGASPETFAGANAADYIVGMPMIVLLYALPAFTKKFAWFSKLWPYSLSDEELAIGDDSKMFDEMKWSIVDIVQIFAIGFIIAQIGSLIASRFDVSIASTVKMLSITTITLIIAQTKPVKKLKGSVDIGFFLIVIFLTIIGALIDVKAFATSSPAIAIYCGVIMIGSLTMHVILCRIFKIKYQYVLCSIASAIADGSCGASIAAAANWKPLIGVSFVLGAIGFTVGNYLGVTIAYAIKAFIGI